MIPQWPGVRVLPLCNSNHPCKLKSEASRIGLRKKHITYFGKSSALTTKLCRTRDSIPGTAHTRQVGAPLHHERIRTVKSMYHFYVFLGFRYVFFLALQGGFDPNKTNLQQIERRLN